MSQTAGFSYAGSYAQAAGRWPALPARTVTVGGVSVTCAQAASALAALEAAGGTMVRQVLAAAANPLARCDYHAAAAPYLTGPYLTGPYPDRPGGYGRGASGRPVTRLAFMAALAAELEQAGRDEPARHFAADLARARAAFSADSGYAAEMAKAAVAVSARGHAAAARARISAAVHQALAACAARSGQFACAAASACGTGDCRLAGPGLDSLTVPALSVPAPAGRVPRPVNHRAAGSGFSLAAALAALEAAIPFAVPREPAPRRRVTGADCACSADSPFGGSKVA